MTDIENTGTNSARAGVTLGRGRFTVERSLAMGSTGEVVVANDAVSEKTVAIKLIHDSLSKNPEFRERVNNECLLHAKLGAHPNLVALFEQFEEAGHIALVMEYVDGESLRARLEPDRQALTMEEAASIAAQVLDALGRLHAHGIVHGSITPGAIQLARAASGEIHAKLTNLGVARLTADMGLSDLWYVTPEQIDPKLFGPLSPATDIYAVAAVFFHMLAGDPPFTGVAPEIMHGHLKLKPSLVFHTPRPVPDRLTAILDKALAKRPEDRYSSAQEFRTDLEYLNVEYMLGDLAAGTGDAPAPLLVASPPVPAPPNSVARSMRNRRRSEIVLITAVAAALLAAWLPLAAFVAMRNRPVQAETGTHQTVASPPTTPTTTARATSIPPAEPAAPPPPAEAEAPPLSSRTEPVMELAEVQPRANPKRVTIARPVRRPPVTPISLTAPITNTESVTMAERPTIEDAEAGLKVSVRAATVPLPLIGTEPGPLETELAASPTTDPPPSNTQIAENDYTGWGWNSSAPPSEAEVWRRTPIPADADIVWERTHQRPENPRTTAQLEPRNRATGFRVIRTTRYRKN